MYAKVDLAVSSYRPACGIRSGGLLHAAQGNFTVNTFSERFCVVIGLFKNIGYVFNFYNEHIRKNKKKYYF
jgi:hypothetical protein